MENKTTVDTPVIAQSEIMKVENEKPENNENASVKATENSVEIPVDNGFQVKFLSLGQVDIHFLV